MTEENAEPTLKIGDAAPPLQVTRWLKGEPISRLEKGTIYVVEFWATWCGPCVRAIPELSKLQQAHPDVIFIGLNCREGNEAAVVKFVERMGDEMSYRVAFDGQGGIMTRTWLNAAREGGIPCSFVVDKAQKIAWIGHPSALGETLKQIIAGTYDFRVESKSHDLDRRLKDALRYDEYDTVLQLCDQFISAMPEQESGPMRALQFEAAIKKQDRALADHYAAVLLDLHQNKGVTLDSMMKSRLVGSIASAIIALFNGTFDYERELLAMDFHRRIDSASRGENVDRKLELMQEFIAAFSERKGMFTHRIFLIARAKKDAALLNQCAEDLSGYDASPFLNHLAWALVDPANPIPGADYALARRLALRALELATGDRVEVLDTAALACFHTGDIAKAVELQAESVAGLAGRELPDEVKKRMRARLEQYRRALGENGASSFWGST